MFLTTHVTVCICHAELKGLLTYLLGTKRLETKRTRAKWQKGETSINRKTDNVYTYSNTQQLGHARRARQPSLCGAEVI